MFEFLGHAVIGLVVTTCPKMCLVFFFVIGTEAEANPKIEKLGLTKDGSLCVLATTWRLDSSEKIRHGFV